MNLRICVVVILFVSALTGCSGLLSNLAMLAVDPITLEFDGRSKELAKDIFISNKGTGTLEWQVVISADDSKWIKATPEKGSGSATVSIQVFPKVQTKPTQSQIVVKNINGNNEVAVKINLTFGETATEGETADGEIPTEGETPPEGEILEGDEPVEGEVFEGLTPAEGDIPAEGETVEGASPAEGEAVEGLTPVEGDIPAEGQTSEGQVEILTPYGLWLEGDPLSLQQEYVYCWRSQSETDLFILGQRSDFSLSSYKASSPYVLAAWGGPLAFDTNYYPYLMDLECAEHVVQSDAFSLWVDEQTTGMTYSERNAFFYNYALHFGVNITNKDELLTTMNEVFLYNMEQLWPTGTTRLCVWDRSQNDKIVMALGAYGSGIRPVSLNDPGANGTFTGTLMTTSLKSVSKSDDPAFYAQVEQLAAQIEKSLAAPGGK